MQSLEPLPKYLADRLTTAGLYRRLMKTHSEEIPERLLSEHAAVCSVWSHMRRLVEEPDAFPLISDRSKIF